MEGWGACWETGQAASPPAPCPRPVHQDRLWAKHLWQVSILVLLYPENKTKCLSFLWGGSQRTTPISRRGAFLEKRRSSVPCQDSEFCWQHTGPFSWVWSAWPAREELHQHHEHSERVALVQGGPSRAWLHGLGAWWQFEESGCRHELAYVSLLCDASLLKASVGQRRHLAQGAKARLIEGTGIHGQTDGNQPIRHGRHAARRQRLPADFCESTAWDLGKQRKRFQQDLTGATGELCLLCLRGGLLKSYI